MFVYNYVHVGVILGNPNAEHVVISDTLVRQKDITAVEALSKELTKFVLCLLDVFFQNLNWQNH